jgi:hypothetical protein
VPPNGAPPREDGNHVQTAPLHHAASLTSIFFASVCAGFEVFDTLTELTEGQLGRLDIPCPECTTWAGRSSNGRRRRVFRVWREHPDFASYHCARCGLSGFARRIGARTRFDPQRVAPMKAEAAERAGDYAADQLRKARWLWRRAVPPRGTIVERYLRHRAIVGRVPSTIRYLPTSRPDRHPAMLVPSGMGTEYEPGQCAARGSTVAKSRAASSIRSHGGRWSILFLPMDRRSARL